jgi:hypothetical protein
MEGFERVVLFWYEGFAFTLFEAILTITNWLSIYYYLQLANFKEKV